MPLTHFPEFAATIEEDDTRRSLLRWPAAVPHLILNMTGMTRLSIDWSTGLTSWPLRRFRKSKP